MATEGHKRRPRSLVWQYFKKLDKSFAKCSLCVKTLQYQRNLYDLKLHLACIHDIYNVQNYELEKWKEESILLWRYFTEDENLTKTTCKCCGSVVAKDQRLLQWHLQHYHSNVIDIIYEKLKCSWVSQHFKFHMKKCDIKCIHCEWIFKIFVEINHLESHLFQCHKINENSGNHEGINDNNRNIMTQQSVAEENYASTSTSSHHDNRNEQNAGNQQFNRDKTNKDSSTSSEDDNNDIA